MKRLLLFTLLFYYAVSQIPFLNEDQTLYETRKFLPTQKHFQTSATKNDFNSTQLIQFIHKIMSCTRIPGMAISVIKDGRVIFAEGFGYRNIETGAKVTPNTLFAIASTTKALTAGLVGMLVEEGKLEWTKPVKTYLPKFSLMDPIASERLSVEDTLLHRSGLPRHDAAAFTNPKMTRDEFLHNAKHLQPSADFRTRWQYNNVMYALAGHLSSKVAGAVDWETLMKQRILGPLEMKTTQTGYHSGLHDMDFAEGYICENYVPPCKGKVVRVPGDPSVNLVGPAGSIFSNVKEMSNWLLMLLQGGQFRDRRLLKLDTVNQLLSSRIVHEKPYIMNGNVSIHSLTYAYGWFVESYRGHYYLQHGGNYGGYSTFAALLPHSKSGFLIYQNIAYANYRELIGYYIADMLLGVRPWVTEEMICSPSKPPIQRPMKSVPIKDASEIAGTYTHPFYGKFIVHADGTAYLNSLNGTIEKGAQPDNYVLKSVMYAIVPVVYQIQFNRNIQGIIESVAIPLEPEVNPIVFRNEAYTHIGYEVCGVVPPKSVAPNAIQFN